VDTGSQLGIRDSALSFLGIPPGNGTRGGAWTISACVMGGREPNPGERIAIGRKLGEQAQSLMADEMGNRTPTGIVDARLAVSDEASCEDPPGCGVSNAFIEGGCCYRLNLKVITDQ
jgi:hypothetical protein